MPQRGGWISASLSFIVQPGFVCRLKRQTLLMTTVCAGCPVPNATSPALAASRGRNFDAILTHALQQPIHDADGSNQQNDGNNYSQHDGAQNANKTAICYLLFRGSSGTRLILNIPTVQNARDAVAWNTVPDTGRNRPNRRSWFSGQRRQCSGSGRRYFVAGIYGSHKRFRELYAKMDCKINQLQARISLILLSRVSPLGRFGPVISLAENSASLNRTVRVKTCFRV